jgi:hypothetical protein
VFDAQAASSVIASDQDIVHVLVTLVGVANHALYFSVPDPGEGTRGRKAWPNPRTTADSATRTKQSSRTSSRPAASGTRTATNRVRLHVTHNYEPGL